MMINSFLGQFSQTFSTIATIVFFLNVILHIIFAGGVAKDVGHLHRLGLHPKFIPGFAWVLSTLIGGVLVLTVYWLMHHSSIAHHD